MIMTKIAQSHRTAIHFFPITADDCGCVGGEKVSTVDKDYDVPSSIVSP